MAYGEVMELVMGVMHPRPHTEQKEKKKKRSQKYGTRLDEIGWKEERKEVDERRMTSRTSLQMPQIIRQSVMRQSLGSSPSPFPGSRLREW